MEEKLEKAKEKLEDSIKSESKVISVVCNVTKVEHISKKEMCFFVLLQNNI